MALNPCRECGEVVSADAKTCPRCGIKRSLKQRIVVGGTTLFGRLALAGCAGSGAQGRSWPPWRGLRVSGSRARECRSRSGPNGGRD